VARAGPTFGCLFRQAIEKAKNAKTASTCESKRRWVFQWEYVEDPQWR